MRTLSWLLLALLIPGLLLAQEEDIESILKDLTPYQKIVEDLRKEKFKKDVPGAAQTLEDFTAFVDETMEREIPPEWLAGWEKSLKKLHLLPGDFEFGEGLRAFLLSQAAAYYDPDQESFFVVSTDLEKEFLETVVVHELQHALQDQLFDLDGMVEKAEEVEDNDRQSAITFLTEGEATFVMMLHGIAQQGGDPDSMGFMLEPMLKAFRRLTPDQLRAMETLGGQDQGGEMEKALETLEGMPSFIVNMFVDPYLEGAYAICKVHTEKGWEGVSDLFRNPPASTEMILHPKKLLTRDDPPVEVEIPDVSEALGEGWKRTFDDTMGEHGIRCMLEDLLHVKETGGQGEEEEGGEEPDIMKLLQGLSLGDAPPSEKAAAGWGGDRYALYENERGATALTWILVFDTEEDGKEFLGIFRDAVRNGFPHALPWSEEEGSFQMYTGSDAETQKVLARLTGKTVHVVIASPNARPKRAMAGIGGGPEGLRR